jgi:hypothetical protein
MSLTCANAFPVRAQHLTPQVKGTRVQVPLGHEPFGHAAMGPVLCLTPHSKCPAIGGNLRSFEAFQVFTR